MSVPRAPHYASQHFESAHYQSTHFLPLPTGKPPGGGGYKPYRLLDPAGKELRYPYEDLAVIIAAIEYYYYD